MTLAGMQPGDELVGGDPRRAKCIHDGRAYIVYAANPDGNNARTDTPRVEAPAIAIRLPEGTYRVRWFDPKHGDWKEGAVIEGGAVRELPAPDPGRVVHGDWLILLQRLD